ncbi:acyl-CoA N-acyltransferase [Sporodiniella umbellata]|nr:acyl-CoA N-acyltransferase [Sporodiniella umbellata]
MVHCDIVVRKVSLEDLKFAKDAALVVNQAYRSKGGWTTEEDYVDGLRCSDEDMEGFIRKSGSPNTLLFAMEQDESVVGTVQLQISEEHPLEAEVGLFSVSPFKQSKGIGAKLLNAALKEMKAQNMTHAKMHVLENRPEILVWYKKMGFVETGERIPFVWPEKLKVSGLHFLVLKKALA